METTSKFLSHSGSLSFAGSQATRLKDMITLNDLYVKKLRENKKLIEEFKRKSISVDINKKISIEKLLARIVGFSKNVQQFRLSSLKYFLAFPLLITCKQRPDNCPGSDKFGAYIYPFGRPQPNEFINKGLHGGSQRGSAVQ